MNKLTEIYYPKVLVIGNRINLSDGGGITFFNLFKGWPQDKISVIATSIDYEGISLCKKYFRIGYDETKRPWPLNKFQPYYESKELIINDHESKKPDLSNFKIKKSRYNSKIKRLITNFLHFSGFYYYFFPIKVSKKLLDWVKREDPDILYTQLGSAELILFIRELIRYIRKPLVIHIMDDWITSLSKGGFAHLYWNIKINKRYVELLNYANGLMSICQTMSEEYKHRYGLDFIPYHNSIDIDFWKKHQKNIWESNKPFQILYAGRIGWGTSESVIKIAHAVEELGKEGLSIEFQIQCKDIPSKYLSVLQELNYVKLNSFIPYNQLPEKFASVDLLVLPMDFDRKNLKYIRLSMPTKVPEYMISGTPIMVFAPEQTALAKYAKEGWAYVTTIFTLDSLRKEIKKLMNDENLRVKIAKKAISFAQENHKIEVVSEQFRQKLVSYLVK